MQETLPFEEEYCLTRLLQLVCYKNKPDIILKDVELSDENICYRIELSDEDDKTWIHSIITSKNKWEFIALAKVWAYGYEPDAINIIESSYCPDTFGERVGKAYLKHFEDDEDKCYNHIYYGEDEFVATIKALKNIMVRGDFKLSVRKGTE